MADLAVKSKSNVQVFESSEFGKLEVVEIDGKPYFPATECAKVLGYANPGKAVLDHCNGDGITKWEAIDSLGRRQEKNYVSEGNLYRLIIRSQLPTADKQIAELKRELEYPPTIAISFACGGGLLDVLLAKKAAKQEELKALRTMLAEEGERA